MAGDLYAYLQHKNDRLVKLVERNKSVCASWQAEAQLLVNVARELGVGLEQIRFDRPFYDPRTRAIVKRVVVN